MSTIDEIKAKLENREVGVIGKRKEFSVLIPVVNTEEGPKLLFEIRGKTINQPGDICFPGGKMEEGEDVFTTALRETEEEIGLDRNKIKVLGQFDSLLEVNRLRLHTVVGLIEEKDIMGLNLCDYEVQEIFLVPLKFFKETVPDYHRNHIIQDDTGFPYEKHGINPNYKWRKAYQDMYFWHWEGKCIWGLTAEITQWFVDEIL